MNSDIISTNPKVLITKLKLFKSYPLGKQIEICLKIIKRIIRIILINIPILNDIIQPIIQDFVELL